MLEFNYFELKFNNHVDNDIQLKVTRNKHKMFVSVYHVSIIMLLCDHCKLYTDH